MAAVARAQQQHNAFVNQAPAQPGPTSAPTLPVNDNGLHHTPPQSISPSSSSPVSPAQQLLQRPAGSTRPPQIGRPRNVGFVPAALRPTERPRANKHESGHAKAHSVSALRGGPPTPPRSLHSGSTDDLAGMPSSRKSSGSSHSSATTRPGLEITTSVPTAVPTIASPTASISSINLAAMVSNAVHPTKAHWAPDVMVNECQDRTCASAFGTFVRRHHCRRCGGIFCYRHTARRVPLDVDARMIRTPLNSAALTADGAEAQDVGWWRACDSCWYEWAAWMQGHDAGDVAGLDTRSFPTGVDGRKPSVASISGSVPRDWNWSTF